jgi:hypothetical protein
MKIQMVGAKIDEKRNTLVRLRRETRLSASGGKNE